MRDNTYVPNNSFKWYLSSIDGCLSGSFVSFFGFLPESFFPNSGMIVVRVRLLSARFLLRLLIVIDEWIFPLLLSLLVSILQLLISSNRFKINFLYTRLIYIKIHKTTFLLLSLKHVVTFFVNVIWYNSHELFFRIFSV